jgi:predicted dehydrogenase
MSGPLRLAVAGLGRMGAIHGLHVHELARDTAACELVAIAEADPTRAHRFLSDNGLNVPVFSSVEELAKSDICQATVIVTPTENHRAHATALIAAGHRVLLEKPLTGALESDREFAAELDRNHPNALMLGFQRRFDVPLCYAKQLMESGAIGRVLKSFPPWRIRIPRQMATKAEAFCRTCPFTTSTKFFGWRTALLPRHSPLVHACIATR